MIAPAPAGPATPAPRRRGALALSLVALAVVGVAASVGGTSPGAATLVAVYPPWWTQARIWTAAISVGEVADVGASPFVLVIHSTLPDVAGRAARSGSVFTLDPGTLGPCRQTPKDTPR